MRREKQRARASGTAENERERRECVKRRSFTLAPGGPARSRSFLSFPDAILPNCGLLHCDPRARLETARCALRRRALFRRFDAEALRDRRFGVSRNAAGGRSSKK